MKIAQTLAALPVNDAMEAAELQAIAKDQNWNLEMTKWTFADNSVLAVRDIEACAIDADSKESIVAYGNWVGGDDAAETVEVARLLEELQ